MGGFLKNIFGGGKSTGTKSKGTKQKGQSSRKVGASADALKIRQLSELIRYYPFGGKISYYPEFQQDCELETIVLGYGVNDQFVYSPANISYQQTVGIDAFRLSVDGQEELLNEVEKFCFLIPFNEDDDNKRGYARRAELGPRGPFSRNNTITLVTSSGNRTVTIDTIVRKIQPIEDDVYAGYKAVLLDILPATLKFIDQRQHFRLPTNLPVKLAVKDGGVYPCTLLDYSESSVRLGMESIDPDLQKLSEFRRLTLTIGIKDEGKRKQFILSGAMYRKSETSMVMNLQGIYKDGELQPLSMVDNLDLKSSILRQSETQKAMDENKDAGSED